MDRGLVLVDFGDKKKIWPSIYGQCHYVIATDMICYALHFILSYSYPLFYSNIRTLGIFMKLSSLIVGFHENNEIRI